MILRILLLSAALAGPAAAQTPLDADAFEALTTGRTLTFAVDGIPYGIEEYRENRQVRWSYIGGECTLGTWYQEADRICFEYERMDGRQCWRFFDAPGGLRAEFADGDGNDVYEVRETDAELECLGPEVGV